MTEKQAKLLAYPFTADEIEWRVLPSPQRIKAKDRSPHTSTPGAIQKRLDDVLGRENWKNHFYHHAGQLQQHDSAYL